jgi:hypothetical protein
LSLLVMLVLRSLCSVNERQRRPFLHRASTGGGLRSANGRLGD